MAETSRKTELARRKIAADKKSGNDEGLVELLESRVRRLETDITNANNREIMSVITRELRVLDELEAEYDREEKSELELLRDANAAQRQYIAQLEKMIAEHHIRPAEQPAAASSTLLPTPPPSYSSSSAAVPPTSSCSISSRTPSKPLPKTAADSEMAGLRHLYEHITGLKVVEHEPATDPVEGDKYTFQGTSQTASLRFSIWLGQDYIRYQPLELRVPAGLQIPDPITQEIEFEKHQSPLFFSQMIHLLNIRIL